MPIVVTAVALIGLAVGSFLNVVVYRVPAGLSVATPASRCPICEHPIRSRHNLPVLGWLLLRGRCADCRSSISPRYPAVEAMTSLLFVAATVVLAHRHQLAVLPAVLFFIAVGIALALIDFDTKKLPNILVLPSYPVLAVLLTIAAVVQSDFTALLRAVICGVLMYGLFFPMWYLYPRGMGFGDVKLAGLIGAITGYFSYSSTLVALFAMFVLGGLAGAALIGSRRGSRKTAIPFGPFMILGGLVALFFATPLAAAYVSLAFPT